MLEDLAIEIFTKSESTIQLIYVGLFAVGAIIAAIVSRSRVEITRAAHFAYLALLTFLVYAVQIVWLQWIPAATGGYLWVLTAISFATSVAGGYFSCCIAMARSRDAYGHGRMAFLAFIPFASFWLWFTPSKNEASANRNSTIPLFSGGLGVLTGFVLLAATWGVAGFLHVQNRTIEQQAQTEPRSMQVLIEIMIRSKGLEETLRLVAAETQTPIAVDEVTTLARIEAAGRQLRRTYLVDREGMKITEKFRTRIRDSICAFSAFHPILRAGGTVREVYVERSGREIGAVIVTRAECGF